MNVWLGKEENGERRRWEGRKRRGKKGRMGGVDWDEEGEGKRGEDRWEGKGGEEQRIGRKEKGKRREQKKEEYSIR